MHAPCGYRQIAFDALTKAAIPWKSSIDANSVQAVQSAVRAGLGVSVLPLSAVQEEMAIVEDLLPKLPNTSVVSFTSPDLANPHAQRFIDFLLSCIEDSMEESVIFLDREKKPQTKRKGAKAKGKASPGVRRTG